MNYYSNPVNGLDNTVDEDVYYYTNIDCSRGGNDSRPGVDSTEGW